MSMSEGAMELKRKEKSVGFMKIGKLSTKVGTTMSETRPRFEDHTQSSLMKRKEPMCPRRYSFKNGRKLKKSEDSTVFNSKLNGVRKRSGIMKQSNSTQALKTILKLKKDYRASGSLQGELTDIAHQSKQRREDLLVFVQANLIEDVSRNLKRCTEFPAKLLFRQKKITKIIDQPEKYAENLHISSQDVSVDFQRCTANSSTLLSSRHNSSKDVCNYSKDHTIKTPHRIQSSDDDEKSHSKVEVHHKSKSIEHREGLKDIFLNGNHSVETSNMPTSTSTSINVVTSQKRTRRICMNRKSAIQGGDVVDVNRTCNTNLQGPRNTKLVRHDIHDTRGKDIRPVTGNNVLSNQKKHVLQKGLASTNQRVWKPPGINRVSTVKSTMSLTQPMQKSYQSTERLNPSTKKQQQSKHSSIEHVESFDSESISISICAKQTKRLMKENRDPRIDRVTKICEHLAGMKQQQRLQNGGALPKRRRSLTRIVCFPSSNLPKASDSKILSKRNGPNSMRRRSRSRSKSRSLHRQMQSDAPKKLSKARNDIGQHHIEPTLVQKKRSRPLDVIHALREIINSTKEDGNVVDIIADVSKNKISDHETNDRETLSNCDFSKILVSNELHFTKTKDSDTVDQSVSRVFWKSIGIQVDLDQSSFLKNDTERDSNLKKILARTVGTQTSPCCNKNVVEIGCNTTPYKSLCKDTMVSCDLIGLTSLKTNDTTTIEDKLISANVSIHTMESSSINHIGTNAEDKSSDESKELLISERKKTLNTETSLKIENHVSAKTAETSSEGACDITAKIEKLIHDEETYQDKIYVKSPKNRNDLMKTLVDNLSLEKPCRSSLSIYDYDASCSSSSEEVAEHLENGIQYKDMIAPKLKAESISSSVIAAFQLAAERARNLHRAIILYNENLMSRKLERQNKEAREGCDTSNIGKYHYCAQNNTFLARCRSESSIKAEYDTKCHFIMTNDKDFDETSTCFSSSSNSDQMYELEPESFKAHRADYPKIGREERSTILPRTEKTMAKSILNECSNFVLDNVRSLIQLSIPRTQEEYALEVLKVEEISDGNDRGFEIGEGKNEILTFPAIGKISIISREHLLPLICCVLCTIVFWCLQFSFTCHSAA